MTDYWDYSYGEDDGSDEWLEQQEDDNAAAWNHQMDLERQQQEEDWQTILDNDPDYHKWADALDREAAFERDLEELAQMENERNFNVLTAWD